MIGSLGIRDSMPRDTAAIERIYAAAFPDEDLIPLVRKLLASGDNVMSLVAVHENHVVGHISFTFCHIAAEAEKVALLAPLAVAPDIQGRGIGSTLVREGCERLKGSGIRHVFVLGDPGYYGRFGFMAEGRVTPPYPLPPEWQGAWQSLALETPGTEPQGALQVPEPWRDEKLWR